MFFVWFWTGVIAVTLIIELITAGFVYLWMSAGAAIALIIAALEGNFYLQAIVFFIISFLLLYFLRPCALKLISLKRIKNNRLRAIGREVRVLEMIDGKKETGKVLYDDMEWKAVASQEHEVFKKGEIAVVEGIQGSVLKIKKAHDI